MAMGLEDCFDEYAGGDDDDDLPSRTECKYCGKAYLYWVEFEGKWRLVDAKYRVHNCLAKKIDLNAALNKPI